MRIATLQGELRAIHLRAHLATRAIRSAAQVARYDELRGYTAAPPELATKPIFMALDCLYVRACRISGHGPCTSAATWSRTCWMSMTWCCRCVGSTTMG